MSESSITRREAYYRLATYLRSNPGSLAKSVRQIARESGLPEDSVRAALMSSRRRQRPEAEAADPFAGLKRAWKRVEQGLHWVQAHPRIYVAVTTLVMAIILLIARAGAGWASLSSPTGDQIDSRIELNTRSMGWIVLLAIHSVAFLKVGRSRVAVFAGLAVFLAALPGLILSLAPTIARADARAQALLIALTPAAALSLGAVYALLGAGICVLGGYFRVLGQEQRERNMTRQQLLDRLFEIEEQLSREPETVRAVKRWRSGSIVQDLRRYPVGVSLVVGVIWGAVTAFLGALWSDGNAAVTALSLPALAIVGTVLQGYLAFFGGHPWRGAMAAVAFYAGLLAFRTLPIDALNEGYILERWPVRIALSFGFSMVVGFFAGICGLLDIRAEHERKLQASDPEALMAEIVSIQLRLMPDQGDVAVLSVDVAGSTGMKAGAVALEAEWSFREFQEFIARVVKANGGRVHAAAGDGVIAAFPTSAEAFSAARAMQTQIEKFNEKVNRLSSPFRLRVGLHRGPVAGDLDSVQFSEVIDVAAKTQQLSQVRGIAVTGPVASQLEGERFAELPEQVQGLKVYIALQPTTHD